MFTTYLPIAEMEFSVLLLLAIGFAVGVLAGFFGVGGGWIITPSLHILGFPIPFAIGTELANITGQSALATIKHRKMGNVDHRLGIVVGICMVVGLEAGKRVILALESLGVVGNVVRLVYLVMLGGLGIFVLGEYIVEMRRRRNAARESAGADGQEDNDVRMGRVAKALHSFQPRPLVKLESVDREVSASLLVGTGVLVGFLAGVLGSGGGFALVPMFVFLIGVPTYVAVSTSLLCVAISGTYGAFTYALNGRVELMAALWMFVGAAVGSQFGSSAVRHVRGYGIRFLYAVMLLVAAGSVLLKHLGLSGPAAVAVLGGALLMCLLVIGAMIAAIVRGRPIGG